MTTDMLKEKLNDTKKFLLSKIDVMKVVEDKIEETLTKVNKVEDIAL
jgi:hypothetical protein